MRSSTQSRAMKKKKKQKQRKVKGGNPFLPQEIITNILKRLPVKSLIRFQCVCKLWKNLIKTQSFIHEHLHHASNQNPCLLFGDFFPLDSLQLYLLNSELKVVEVHCASLFDLLRRSVIIDSINGLLCLKVRNSSHPFVLWNPAIRQIRVVPEPANNFSFRLGFGFSSIVNDYNILAIDSLPGMPDLQAEVYSLKRDSWKKVDSSPLKDLTIFHDNFAAHGSIFWVGYKYNVDLDSKVHVLVSYDMAVDVFTLIPSPISPLKAFDLLSTRLTIHENKLAILSRTSIGDPVSSLFDLWVMEDGTGKFGERCGWTKKFSISHPFLSFARTIWRNKMVCLPKSIAATEVEMLADERKSIALVNLTTSEVNMFAICIYGMPHPFLNHVESLVPISNDHIEEL